MVFIYPKLSASIHTYTFKNSSLTGNMPMQENMKEKYKPVDGVHKVNEKEENSRRMCDGMNACVPFTAATFYTTKYP